jgi:hypothetical protein
MTKSRHLGQLALCRQLPASGILDPLFADDSRILPGAELSDVGQYRATRHGRGAYLTSVAMRIL